MSEPFVGIKQGQTWVPEDDVTTVTVLNLCSECLWVLLSAEERGDGSFLVTSWTWTEFRDWQQRHAARVQTEENVDGR